MHAVADIDVPQAMPGVDPAPAAATVIVRVESAPEAAVEADAVKAVKAAMETAMADEVAATKAANGEMVATKAAATEAMAAAMTTAAVTATAMTTSSVAATTAGVGHLGQREDHGDKHGKDQIEQLTTHETLLFIRRFSPVAINVLG
jgi:hypothetical protein